MATFFSGTDTGTLQEEGNDTNHFVSLIVNNVGKYTAAVTRKIKKVQTIIENYSYPTWGGKESVGKTNYLSEEECIEYYYLNIEKVVSDFEDEMSQRLEEIRESKRKANVNTFFCNNSRNIPTTSFNPMNYSAKIETPKVKQTEFNFEEEGYNVPYGKVHINKEVVEDLVRQIVTSSVIIPNTSNIDIKKWASNMPKLYKIRFGDLETFEEFATNYINFLLNNANYDDYGSCYKGYGANILAYDIIEELKKLPQNNWLDTYMALLDEYII